MQQMYQALSWIFGGFLLITGLAVLFVSIYTGLCLIVISLFLLPPARDFVFSKTNKQITTKIRAIIIILLFFSIGLAGLFEQPKDAVESKTSEIKEERVSYFNSHKDEILESIQRAINNVAYESAIDQSSPFLIVGDQQLNELYGIAKSRLAQIEAGKKTEKLSEQLRNTPETYYNARKELYQQLADLHPNNKEFQEGIRLNSQKIKEKQKIAEEKNRQATVHKTRKERIESQFHFWDGSHNNLERYIKEHMHDPDSYDHVETVYWDKGNYLIVKTKFRGKNAFGALILSTFEAKVTLDGQILDVKKIE